MPLFDYTCDHCGGVATDVLIPSAEDKKKKAPKCPKCKRKMEPVEALRVSPFQWGKGGGWN